MSQLASPQVDPLASTSREKVERTRGPMTPLFVGSLIACGIVAILTRWLFLDADSLWFDEGWTWWLISHPASRMFHFIRADTVAPIYFYSLRAWTRIFGDDAFAMRSMSALLATLALVPWGIIAWRAELSRRAIVLAAVFMAFSGMQSQYAREARPYAMLTLFTLSALACVPTLANRRSWPAMLCFAFCTSAGLFTHNVMSFYAPWLAAAWLVWPGERPLRSRLVDLAIAVGFCIVAYAPWLPVLRGQTKWVDGNFWVSPPHALQVCVITSTVCGVDVYDVAETFWRFLHNSPFAGTLAVFVTTSTIVVTVLSIFQRDVIARRRALALACITFGPMVTVFVYSRVAQPIFLGRLFSASSALLPLVFAMSTDGRRRRSVQVTASILTISLVLLGATSVLTQLTLPQKEDWRGTYDCIAHLPPSPRRVIVFMATEGELPYLYYASRDTSRTQEPRTGSPGGFFDIDPPRTIRRVRTDADMAPMRATLVAGAFDEVVLVLSHQAWVDPDGRTRAWFEQHWNFVDETKLLNVRVVRFRAK